MRVETANLLLRGARSDPEQITQEIEWLNDPEVVTFSEQRHKRHTYGTQYDYIRAVRWPNMLMEIHLKPVWDRPAVLRPEGTITTYPEDDPGKFIGTFSVYVDQPNKIADFGVMIGAKDCWKQGYARQAWAAMAEFVFANMPIDIITGGCMAQNIGMLRVMQACEMRLIGSHRYRFLLGDKRADAILYGLWRKKYATR